jgi:dienelactone hydrolase
LLLADAFGRAGYKVYIPDILQGDDAIQGETDLAAWLPNHSAEITRPFVDSFLEKLSKGEEFEFLGLVGYCFGAKYVIQQLTSNTKVTAGAVAHPSFVTIEEVAAIEKPILISAAEIDSIFTEDLRHLTESKLKEIGVDYQIDLFGGVTHGFAVKGDISIPKVKYAKEKAFSDHVYWFNYHSGAI